MIIFQDHIGQMVCIMYIKKLNKNSKIKMLYKSIFIFDVIININNNLYYGKTRSTKYTKI